MSAEQQMDVAFVIDATASMGAFLNSLTETIPQLTQLTRILGNIDRLSIIAYRDYCDTRVITWSGWQHDLKVVASYARDLRPFGGGDAPEAAKTAAALLAKECSKPTLTIWYTDAPPHHKFVGSDPRNLVAEKNALGNDFDWVQVCKNLAAKQVRVFSFISTTLPKIASFYSMLAHFTDGNCIALRHTTAKEIAKHTIGLFLGLINHEYCFDNHVFNLTLANFDSTSIKDEHDCNGFLPSYGVSPQVRKAVMDANALKKLDNCEQFQDLVTRFQKDPSFKKTVYQVFDDVLKPEMIIALTYNTVFGTLWRAICRSKEDPDRVALMNRMGSTVSVLREDEKEQMKAYIEMSYDQTNLIDEMIQSVEPYPAIVLETPQSLTRSDLLEVSRSCYAGVLSKVSTLLTGLRVVESPATDMSIPLALPHSELFQVLPHLMAHGTMFSRRPAAILAALGVYTNSILKDAAQQFLDSIKGNWIDFSEPENSSMDFAKLMLNVPDALNSKEREYFEHLRKIGGLSVNGLTDLDVITGHSSLKTVRPDRKVFCPNCKLLRSETLIVSAGICALCVDENVGVDEPLASDKSYWCECRTCKVHYAVVRIKDLNVEPKCFFCRFSKGPSPHAKCLHCHNKFLHQTGSNVENYVCPPCSANNGPLTTTEQSSVMEYLRQNGTAFLGLEIKNLESFFSSKSAFRARDMVNARPEQPLLNPTFNGKVVHNADKLHLRITNWIDSGIAEQGTCQLCYSDLPKKQLLSVCGHKRCKSSACSDCLDSWYSSVQPGQLCLPPRLLCPFCKAVPSSKTLQRHNRELCMLNVTNVNHLDPAWYHGWCIGCYHIRPALEKVCAEDMPQLRDWRCDDCQNATRSAELGAQPDVATKPCPSCGVLTWKSSGCDHIHCSNMVNGIACSAHWCFRCGELSSYEDIYRHMSSAHGGYGIDDYGYDNYSDDDDY